MKKSVCMISLVLLLIQMISFSKALELKHDPAVSGLYCSAVSNARTSTLDIQIQKSIVRYVDLENPFYYVDSGQISEKPVRYAPGSYRARFIKSSFGLGTGSTGVLSYSIKLANQLSYIQLVLFFENPGNSWPFVGVCVIDKSVKTDKNLYKNMFNKRYATNAPCVYLDNRTTKKENYKQQGTVSFKIGNNNARMYASFDYNLGQYKSFLITNKCYDLKLSVYIGP